MAAGAPEEGGEANVDTGISRRRAWLDAQAPLGEPENEEGTPERAFHRTVEEGRRRLSRGLAPMLATGFVGGVDVGTGVLGLLLVEAATGSKLLGGLAFSIGFIALLLARSELFTEDFLVPVIAVAARRARLRQLFQLWGLTLVANLVGGWILTLLIVDGFPSLHAKALEIGTSYARLGFGWKAFSLGLLGGLVITLMTWMHNSSEAHGSRVVASIGSAWLLGAGSLNHAIVASLLMFAALHTGHAPFGYWHWLAEMAFAAVANLVGGVGLVTVLRLLQVPHRLASERSQPL